MKVSSHVKWRVHMCSASLLLLVSFVLPQIGFCRFTFAEEVPGRLEDEVGLLYSSQVQFGDDGFPRVTIGIVEGTERVSIASPGGLELTFFTHAQGQRVEKTIKSPPGQDWHFEVGEATPAKVTYWCGVQNLHFNQKQLLNQSIATWSERGEKVQVFEVGSVFGIQGLVIDNRTYILGIRSYEREEDAKAATTEIFEKYGSRTFVHAHLARRPSGVIRVVDSRNHLVAEASELIKIRPNGSTPVTVRRVEYGKGYQWHGYADRQYAGSILVTLDRNGRLAVVNRIGVERLLEGLVPVEIHSGVPMEALKAQSVVARGEVFAKIGSRHFLDPYLLCASTHCQVYSGVGVEKERSGRAVRATQGELLFLGTGLVDSVYSASCGGHTEDNDSVWSDPPSPSLRGKPDMPAEKAVEWVPVEENLRDWLRSEPDAFCRRSTLNPEGVFRWERTISSREMDSLVAKVKPIGQVVSIQVLSRGVSGRVKVIRLVGTEGDLLVQREWPVRQLLGNLRSGMFEVSVDVNEDQMPVAFRFTGGGWGHGAGMCQIGAVGMAESGYDYQEILSHYYGGAKVHRLYGAAVNRGPEARIMPEVPPVHGP